MAANALQDGAIPKTRWVWSLMPCKGVPFRLFECNPRREWPLLPYKGVPFHLLGDRGVKLLPHS